MSELSEEEIQKIKCIHLADYKASDKLCPAIEELKKEKEKNRELVEIKYVASIFIDRSMNQFSIGEFRYKVNSFKENYISKDKIREFALSESQADTYNFKTISLDRLLELLEEE